MPGERRGGRKVRTPYMAAVLRNAAPPALRGRANVTPLEFSLIIPLGADLGNHAASTLSTLTLCPTEPPWSAL